MSIAMTWPARISYTIDEAVFAAGVSKRQLYRALETGQLRAAFVAGRRRIAPADLELYLRGEPMPTTPAPGPLRHDGGSLMPVFTLITGKLCSTPETKPAKNSVIVCFYKVRVKADIWSCSAVSEAARAEIDGLPEGTPLSVSGLLSLELIDVQGKTEIKRSITGARILSLRPDHGQAGRERVERREVRPDLDKEDDLHEELPSWISRGTR